MSQEKTLITHATEEKARFLNYEIHIQRNQDKKARLTVDGNRTRKRSLNGKVLLLVPKDVMKNWKARVTKGNKIKHRAYLIHNSDFDIISTHEKQLQGLINYYLLASNVRIMHSLRYCYEESLVKTLAAKYKTKTARIRRRASYQETRRPQEKVARSEGET